ncbi:hypothetical protein OG866_25965 [Streptomyces sp. NBC_00663]|uniref:hypothetical protein n=1 Tax=Streptomyces sp. NBC_00663 TaxID=2975801 RepID=UPI002E37C319|nr:hypothetical protein [Streptomyces sp. NBC_00663]
MRMRCFRSGRPARWGGHVAAIGLTVLLGLGTVTGCGASAGAGGDDPGGGGPAPGATGPAGSPGTGAGYGSVGGGSDGTDGADGGGGDGGTYGDPGVPGVAPPSDSKDWDSISVGLDGGIGGVDSTCPSPDQIDYPYCSSPPSPTDGGGASPVTDPPVGDTLPPVDPSAAPGDNGAGLSPGPT